MIRGSRQPQLLVLGMIPRNQAQSSLLAWSLRDACNAAGLLICFSVILLSLFLGDHETMAIATLLCKLSSVLKETLVEQNSLQCPC